MNNLNYEIASSINCGQAACKLSIPKLRSTPMPAIEIIMLLADLRGIAKVRDGDLFQPSYPDCCQMVTIKFVFREELQMNGQASLSQSSPIVEPKF